MNKKFINGMEVTLEEGLRKIREEGKHIQEVRKRLKEKELQKKNKK